MPRPENSRRNAWGILFWVTALIFLLSAVSDEVYDITTPPSFAFHVLLRKILSVGAFAATGFCYAKWRFTQRPLHVAAVLAAYSATIEVAQYLHGVREGLPSNVFDVACGWLGGAIGSLIAGATEKKRSGRAAARAGVG